MEQIVIFFWLMVQKLLNLRQKKSEIVATLLNISKKISVDNNELFMILVLIMILLQLMIY